MTVENCLKTKTNCYCGDSKLKSFPKALLFNFFSFIEESDLACFSSSCRLLSSLQKQYSANLIDNRCTAWKKIINSQSRVVEFNSLGANYRLINNHFFFSSNIINGQRFFIDLTNLSITPNAMEYPDLIKSNRINERISVSREYDYTSTSLIVFDNEKREQIYKINLKNDYGHSFNAIIGTKIKGQTLEFIKKSGFILQLDPNKFEKEEKELSEEQLNIISCRPKEYQYSNDNIINGSFKIKNIYYFQWQIGSVAYYTYPVIALKDINVVDQRKILQEESNICIADDHFLYVSFKNLITIYKGETIWKKIIINEEFATVINIYPTDYGLVIKFYNKKHTHISIWDHRTYDPKPQITPLFEKVIENDRAPIFVRNDLLIYLEFKKWIVFHIARKEVLGTLPIFRRDIQDIVTSNDSTPKHLIVQLGDCHSEDHDFQIFSNKQQ